MRYLGNKTSLLNEIKAVLDKHHLLIPGLRFFDACCGTGVVSYMFKDLYSIILNDNLRMATTFAAGHLFENRCNFERLGFDPFYYFNSNTETLQGFFYNNYAPSSGGRMYFSDFNASRIDYFRATIETWYQDNRIGYEEYLYLLASLIESVSLVANVAGVYGAFLKSWDPRAKKDIIFKRPCYTDEKISSLGTLCPKVEIHNNNIENSIEDIDCDILYFDPPYTKNSYSVQYHILETLVRNDSPELRGITGARSWDNVSNIWSKPYEVEVAFERIIAKTKAKHIVFSYSTDGLMSKEYILYVLKRHCYPESIECEEITYKKYRNSRSANQDEHFEYIFYAEKKPIEDVEYYCPLNYMGGKTNVIRYIKPHLNGRSTFVDLMGGGFNVGINTNGFQKVIYNDVNFIVKDLLQMFKELPTAEILRFVDRTVSKYGLTKHDKEAYNRIRSDYNTRYRTHSKANLYLYTVILYGFQQQIRFNSNHEFNNPVGESGYSDSIKEKIVSFSRRLKEMDVEFHESDFEEIENKVTTDSLIYADPPYLITLGSYNDGKRGFNGWNENDESRLLALLTRLHNIGCKIVISNILEYKGKTNEQLTKWVEENDVNVHDIEVRKRKECLIVTR
ncbi:MAG: DNA adenine methylase [Bacteroidales bacterium]|nr:DNA adenine methylase [Candidatus Liminaster caballi]